MKILAPIDIGDRTSPELCGTCTKRIYGGCSCTAFEIGLVTDKHYHWLRCQQCLDAEVVE